MDSATESSKPIALLQTTAAKARQRGSWRSDVSEAIAKIDAALLESSRLKDESDSKVLLTSLSSLSASWQASRVSRASTLVSRAKRLVQSRPGDSKCTHERGESGKRRSCGWWYIGARTFRSQQIKGVMHFCTAITSRVRQLQAADVLQASKQKAFVDLLRGLRSMGLSSLSVTVPAQVRPSSTGLRPVFEVPDSISIRSLIEGTSLSHSCAAAAEKLWSNSRWRFAACLARLQRLRVTAAMGYSTDLSAGHVKQMIGFASHLFFVCVQQRRAISLMDRSSRSIRDALHYLKSSVRISRTIGESSTSVRAVSGQQFLNSVKSCIPAIDRALNAAAQCRTLVEERLSTERETSCRESGDRAWELLNQAVDSLGSFRSKIVLAASNGVEVRTETEARAALDRLFVDAAACTMFSNAIDHLENHSGIVPSAAILPLRRIRRELKTAIDSAYDIATESRETNREGDVHLLKALESVLECLLLSSQRLRVLGACDIDDENADCTFVRTHIRSMAAMRSLRIRRIASALWKSGHIFEAALVSRSFNKDALLEVSTAANSVIVGASAVMTQIENLSVELVQSNAAALELERVILCTFQTLLAKGFCRPPPSHDDEDDEDGDDGEAAEGTGMGEGNTEGAKDVSEEIEDEEQLLGLEGEEKEQTLEGEQEDNGVEMSNDFEGDMCDIEQEEGKDEDDEDGDDDEEQMDREMGDFDDEDENVVDERLWDEEEDETKEEDQKHEKDAPVHGGASDEVRAQDDDDDDDDDGDDGADDAKNPDAEDDTKKTVDETEEDHAEEEDEKEESVSHEDAVEERHHDVDLKDVEEENEKFKLPEEDHEEEDVANDDDDDDDENTEEKRDDDEEDIVPDVDHQVEETDPDDSNDPDIEADESASKIEDDEEDEGDENRETTDKRYAPEENEEPSKEETVEDENNEVTKEEEEMERAEDMSKDPKEEFADQDATEGERDHRMQRRNLDDTKEDVNEDEDDHENQQSSSMMGGTASKEKGEWREGMRPEPISNDERLPEKPTTDESREDQPNPLKNFDEALRHWKREIRSLKIAEENNDDVNNNEKEEDEGGAGLSGADDVMFDEGADEKEATPENTVLAPESAKTEEDEDENAAMDEDDPEGEDSEVALPVEKESETSDVRDDPKSHIEEKNNEDALEDEEENRLSRSDRNKKHNRWEKLQSTRSMEENADDEASSESGDAGDDDDEDRKSHLNPLNASDAATRDSTPLPEHSSIISRGATKESTNDDDDKNTSDDDVRADLSADDEFLDLLRSGRGNEANVRQLKELMKSRRTEASSRGGDNDGLRAWRTYEAITAHQSQQLCEQLRLLLEPTEATRLRGDYRTGKRINMRKVIPYIASQFRKDKIWLRRTLPSKRTYQIVLAIDDSRSMSPCRQMACEVVATICTAMTRLEVGEIALATFGEDFKLLHPMDETLSDEVAGAALESFTFEQETSDFVLAMKSIMNLLTVSRAQRSGGGRPLAHSTQLVFIISDGKIMKDRDRVLRLAREAERLRQMFVIVIVDNAEQAEGSIFSLNQVEWVNGSMNIRPYLEGYPFVYYVVVQKLGLLSDVISDALRQWFEIIAQEQ
eukprot:g1564.t1